MDRAQAAAVLGVPLTASASEVDEAYRLQARLLHPDRWALFGESERRAAAAGMERVNEARDVLQDRRAPTRWRDAPAPAGAAEPGVASRASEPRSLEAEYLQNVLRTVRREWTAFADNPYAPGAWLLLAAVALVTGLLGLFWVFLALAVWSYLRQWARVAAG